MQTAEGLHGQSEYSKAIGHIAGQQSGLRAEGLDAARRPAELDFQLVVGQYATAQVDPDTRFSGAQFGHVDLVATIRTGQIGRQGVGIGCDQTNHRGCSRRIGVHTNAVGHWRDAA